MSNHAEIENLDDLLTKWPDVNPLSATVPLDRRWVNVQGPPKSGTSSLFSGCGSAIVCHCFDGDYQAPSKRAYVHSCHSLEEVLDFAQDIYRMGKKYGDKFRLRGSDGVKRNRHMFVIDRTTKLCEWAGDVLIAEHNKRVQSNRDACQGEIDEDDLDYRFVKDVTEIKTYGNYSKITKTILRPLNKFVNIGWGVGTATHYRRKFVPPSKAAPKGFYEWKPDIYPSVADALANMHDVKIVCEVESVKNDESGSTSKTFRAIFAQDVDDGAGSRVPLHGQIELPDYWDRRTDMSITTWDIINGKYVKAMEKAFRREHRFRKQESDRK